MTQRLLLQLRAYARRMAKLTGQLAGALDFFGLTFLANVLQAIAMAFVLLALLVTLLLRQARRASGRVLMLLRHAVLRMITLSALAAIVVNFAGLELPVTYLKSEIRDN